MRLPLAAVAALLAAGCACDYEEATELAAEGAAHHRDGRRVEALASYVDAGECALHLVPDDSRAKVLLAALYARFHRLGGRAALPPGRRSEWAIRELTRSGERDFLSLAMTMILELEAAEQPQQDTEPWMKMEADRVVADTVLGRWEETLREIPAPVYLTVPEPYVRALVRMGALEMARAFLVQAWRTAMAAELPVEELRRALSDVYRGMGQAAEALAGVPGISEGAKTDFLGDRDRLTGLSERVQLLLSPDDLSDPVGREMLQLSVEAHLKQARGNGMAAQQQKQAGNVARARAHLLEFVAHLTFAILLGIPEGAERESMLGYGQKAMGWHWDLSR